MKMLIYICLFLRVLAIATRVKDFEINKECLWQLALNLISVGLLLKLLICL